jgi:hypothetical protein
MLAGRSCRGDRQVARRRVPGPRHKFRGSTRRRVLVSAGGAGELAIPRLLCLVADELLAEFPGSSAAKVCPKFVHEGSGSPQQCFIAIGGGGFAQMLDRGNAPSH